MAPLVPPLVPELDVPPLAVPDVPPDNAPEVLPEEDEAVAPLVVDDADEALLFEAWSPVSRSPAPVMSEQAATKQTLAVTTTCCRERTPKL